MLGSLNNEFKNVKEHKKAKTNVKNNSEISCK